MNNLDKGCNSGTEDISSQMIQNSNDDKIDTLDYGKCDFTLLSEEEQMDKAYLFFNDNKFDNLYRLMNQVQGLNLISLVDKKRYTLIHRVVLNNQSVGNLRFIIEYMQKQLNLNNYTESEIQDTLAEWLNQQSDGGFRAIHYASYRGDLPIIKYIIQKGGDYSVQNSKGLNVIHIAAQGDQPISIRFFQKIGMNIEDLDFKKGNALHWACFLGNENSINYLTSYTDIDINQPDQQGLSPLHLAVISGNAKAVKKLLLKGANRKMKESQGKTPAELALQEGYENIANMIDSEDGFQEYCNLRQPFRPINKSAKQVVIFYILFIIVQAIFVVFIVPCLDTDFIEFSIWAVFSFLCILFQISVWFANPGRVSGINNMECIRNSKLKQNQISCVSSNGVSNQNSIKQTICKHNTSTSVKQTDGQENKDSVCEAKDEQNSQSVKIYEESKSFIEPLLLEQQDYIKQDVLIQLLRCYQIDEICLECQIIKPARSKHCEICKECVRVYDHHCPWVNNCIGVNNYKYFISFIIFLWFTKMSLIIITLLHIVDDYDYQENEISNDNTYYSIFFWFKGMSDEDKHSLFILKYVASAVILAVTIPFVLMLSVLCFVQLNNLFLNNTTYERFNVHAKSQLLTDSLSSSKEPNNLDSEMFNNLAMKDSTIIKRKKKSLLSQKSYSIKNAYKMCYVNQKDFQLDFNKELYIKKLAEREKEEEHYY